MTGAWAGWAKTEGSRGKTSAAHNMATGAQHNLLGNLDRDDFMAICLSLRDGCLFRNWAQFRAARAWVIWDLGPIFCELRLEASNSRRISHLGGDQFCNAAN